MQRQHLAHYVYDGRGVRVKEYLGLSETSLPFTRNFQYSPDLRLLNYAHTAANHTWRSDFVWFGALPVGQLSNDPYSPTLHGDELLTFRYTFTDHLGTPLLQMNGADVVWRAEYEPYGGVYEFRAGNAENQRLRLPGQEATGQSNGNERYYNIFRWYRSEWGRYTQADPLGLRAGLNLFVYVGGNPLVWADPYGTVKWSKNAPIYTTSYQDDIFHRCGPESYKAGGCTDPTGSGSKCKCPCVNGGNKLEITMTLNLHVWARHDDPRATVAQIFVEEQKHVAGWTHVFDQFIAIAETYEQVYASPDACWDACKEFTAKFKATWNKSTTDVDKTHPKLGGGL